MFAIFKREIRSFFFSPVAYVTTGLFILIISFFFNGYLADYKQSDITGLFPVMGIILIFLMPVLTMRVFAEEKRNGTDVLLITSPVSITRIVIGKYLASLVVFISMLAVTLIYPLVVSLFGKPPMPEIIGCYIGMLLMGATFLAVGTFASSLTENQVIAAIVGIVSLLVMWIIQPVADSVGGLAAKILNWFSLLSRFEDFSKGVFNLIPVVYYLSFTAVFIFMTIRVIEKRRWSRG